MLGELKWLAFPFAPPGWANCAGQQLSVTAYPDLFPLLGTRFGGDGKTSFGLPNTSGRLLLGSRDAQMLAATGGAVPNELGATLHGASRLSFTVLNCVIAATSDADLNQPYYGEIRPFGGGYAPAGWAICDGSAIRIADNPALFNLIGTTFGGDGNTTFCLPDLRGRAPVGAGTASNGMAYNVGATGSAVAGGAGAVAVHYLISVAGIYPPRND